MCYFYFGNHKTFPHNRDVMLWNTASWDGHGNSQMNQKELYLQLKMKDYFKNFKFNLLSAERHRFEPQILYTNVASVVLFVNTFLFIFLNQF